MNFEIVEINNHKCLFKAPLVSDVAAIAEIPSKYEYKRMALWLTKAMRDAAYVKKMTLQERYAWFISFLNQSNQFDRLDIGAYLNPVLNDFNTDRVDIGNGLSVRHLRGVEAEALELGCEAPIDWIKGEMALTVACDDLGLPAMDIFVPEPRTIATIIQTRLSIIDQLDIYTYNEFVEKYNACYSILPTLVNMFNDEKGGYSVDKYLNEGGADDKTARFRVADCIIGPARQLLG